MSTEKQEFEVTDLETKLLYLFAWLGNPEDPSPVCKVLEVDRAKLDEAVQSLVDKGLLKRRTVN